MKILFLLILISSVSYGEDAVAEIQRIVGAEYAVISGNDGLIEIKSVQEYSISQIFESGPPTTEFKMSCPYMFLSIISIRRHEKVEDIVAVNAFLQSREVMLRNIVTEIPHDTDSKSASLFGFRPRNNADLGVLAEYDLIRSGIRHVPDVYFNKNYYYINCPWYVFEDKVAENKFNEMVAKIRIYGDYKK